MTIHSAEDVKEVIETETNLIYDIKVHTAEEIKQVRDSLPKLGQSYEDPQNSHQL